MDPLLSDALYLFALLKRVVPCIIQRSRVEETPRSQASSVSSPLVLKSPPPPLHFSSAFISIDKRLKDQMCKMTVKEVMETIRPIFAAHPNLEKEGRMNRNSEGVWKLYEKSGTQYPNSRSQILSPKEIQLLQYLLPIDDEGRKSELQEPFSRRDANLGGRLSSDTREEEHLLSPAEVLFYLIQLVPQQSFVVDQIVQQVRQAVRQIVLTFSVTPDSLFSSLLRENTCLSSSCSSSSPILVVSGARFVSFLQRECGLSGCQAITLGYYCKLEGSTVSGGNGSTASSFSPPSSTSPPFSRGADENELLPHLDGDLVYRLCFAVEKAVLDDYVAYPLLARQFTEAVVDPYASASFGHSSGSLFLESVIQYLIGFPDDAQKLTNTQRGGGRGIKTDTATPQKGTVSMSTEGQSSSSTCFSLPLVAACYPHLEERQFRQLCWLLGTPEHIISPLFFYLSEKLPTASVSNAPSGILSEDSHTVAGLQQGKHDKELRQHEQPQESDAGHPPLVACSIQHRLIVPVPRLMAMFYQFFPSPSLSMWILYRSAFVQSLQKTENPLVFVELFTSLRQWGVGPIPIAPYLQAMRQAFTSSPIGTTSRTVVRSSTTFTDIELEFFRCGRGDLVGDGKDRVSLLRTLTTPVAASRQAVIEKVWNHLEELHSAKYSRAEATSSKPSAQKSSATAAETSHFNERSNRSGVFQIPLNVDGPSIPEKDADHNAPETKSLSVKFILDSFLPDRIEGNSPQNNAIKVKEAMNAYFQELAESWNGEECDKIDGTCTNLPIAPSVSSTANSSVLASSHPEETLQQNFSKPLSRNEVNAGMVEVSFAEFHFFLSILSAGVEDDPAFTMMLWRGFGIGTTVSRRVRKSEFV